MFGKKKQVRMLDYDPAVRKPVIRCSICNGEQVGGLKNLKTGEFEEVMLIRDDGDLARFQQLTGVRDIPKVY